MRQRILVGLAFLGVGSFAHAQGRGEMATTWTLIEDLRIGGEDDGPKSFSDIRSVIATKNGNIFILDFKQRVIRLFDSRGNFIKQVARDGAGPGEIRNANGLAVGANDIVWVNDPQNSRFDLYKSDGSFYKQVSVPINMYSYTWDGVIDEKGRAVDRISVVIPDAQPPKPQRQSKFRIVDENGKADTVDAPSCPPRTPLPQPAYLEFRSDRGSMMSMGIPFLAQGQVVNTATGTVWCTAAAEYSLWSGRLGQPVREVVNYRIEGPRVSDDERRKSQDRIDSLTRAYGKMTVGDASLIPKVKPVIARIHGDQRGRIWVRQTATSDSTPSFDVYDPDGKPVTRVNSRGKISPYLTWISDSHVYSVVLNDDDVPTVVRYRIVK